MGRLIEEIVELEWEMFQCTQNIGGRASCQDDRRTFFLMRKSQWSVMSEELLESIYKDLQMALAEGRNMVSEKYGFMMENYDPEGFAAILERLPVKTEQERRLAEEIVACYIEWNEELRTIAPYMMGNGRALRSSSDSIGNVSVETYLRGELLTFSENTLQKYLDYVNSCRTKKGNLSLQTYEAMARAYGYRNLEEAERFLRDKKIDE